MEKDKIKLREKIDKLGTDLGCNQWKLIVEMKHILQNTTEEELLEFIHN